MIPCVFECPALQGLRDRSKTLFKALLGDAMILFMWQPASQPLAG